MRLSILAVLIGLAAPAVQADTFSLSLGNGPIGTLNVTADAVRSSVTDSPLGLANGRFEATAKRVRTASGDVVTQYLSQAPSKGRTISVLLKDARALETVVSPAKDATDLSVASAVPAGVTHPVGALNRIVNASGGCPGPIQFYDGRRVITISPDGAAQDGETLTCDMRYRVTAGPGHLSPLFISGARMSVTYTTAGGQQMAGLTLSSGPFTLYVTR